MLFHEQPCISIHVCTHENADCVVGLDCARGSVLEVGALGHAREDGHIEAAMANYV